MWGIGCVTGELFTLLKSVSPTFLDRQPLFQGKSCFPLSPSDKPPQQMVNGFPMTSSDQICKIFSLLGTPNKEDMSFVTDKKALDYITSFDDLPREDLKAKFAGIPDEGIDFLDKLLQFNPYFRMTLDQAINHPFFAEIQEESNYKKKELKKPKTLK